MYKVLNRSHSKEYEKHNFECFNTPNSAFWIRPDLLQWSSLDEMSFIIGFYEQGELVGAAKWEMIHSEQQLLTKLVGITKQNLPPNLRYPVIYTAQSSSSPKVVNKGLNTRLRKVSLKLAQLAGIPSSCTTMIKDSPRIKTLENLGYQFSVNQIKWNTASYKSDRFGLIGVIDLDKSLENLSEDLGAQEHEFIISTLPAFLNWLDSEKHQQSKRNHFRFGFNNQAFAIRKSPQDRFFAAYGTCSRSNQDFRSECLLAAQEIYQLNKKPLYLCFSGGADSEIMCESFRQAKVPFKVVIARFNENLNNHDYKWALKYCDQHSIQPVFYDLDVYQFFETEEHRELLRYTGCGYPMLSTQMKLMQFVTGELAGVPVLGSSECWIKKLDRGWFMIEEEPIQSLHRFLKFNHLEGIPGFFQWSPELMLSYLLDPLLVNMANNQMPAVESSYDIKIDIYRNYFPIEARSKYTGYEQFEDLIIQKRAELAKVYIGPKVDAITEYHSLVNSLRLNYADGILSRP